MLIDRHAYSFGYLTYLEELEQVARRTRERPPRPDAPHPFLRTTRFYMEEWWPAGDRARQFLLATIAFSRSPLSSDEGALGAQGKRVIPRTLFFLGAAPAHRPRRDKDVEGYRTDVHPCDLTSCDRADWSAAFHLFSGRIPVVWGERQPGREMLVGGQRVMPVPVSESRRSAL
jgi:hypothetical protein